MAQEPSQFYSGNHGFHAVKMLAERFPKNKNFERLRCSVVIASSNAENFKHLFILGTFENTVHSLAKKTGFAETCLRMRQQYTNLVTECSGDTKSGEWRTKSGALLRSAQAAFNWNSGETNLCWLVASSDENVWDLLEAILKGNTKHANPMTHVPRSSHHLNSMAKIPNKVLIDWLKQVCEAQMTLKDFKERCVMYRIENKTWAAMIVFASEYLIPPPNSNMDEKQEAKWRRDMASYPEATLTNIQTNYPGLKKLVQEYAWESKKAALKNIPTPNALSRFRAEMDSHRETQKALMASGKVLYMHEWFS